ncbi:hypothetical protein AIOL_002093 [Candidatus Rhodobacter oscarellae]|uniref:Clp protease n=1 Tax=Candidatus Rhodobacter oscarellae TaxID=1675527 RepID=A0A0J9GU98_9RHOB|nr:hypothetical protein [Candidatus Rhodobacter lobularis]KMW57133.1 hypothetical protein AIOL_002093 [Candidatus Rhodobacter lobularis]
MSEKASGGLNVARGIKLILLGQIAIAVILFSGDILRVLPSLGASSVTAPRLTQPVAPGDQMRRYDPRQVPTSPDAPDVSDLPSRLLFEGSGDALTLTGAIAVGDAERFDDYLRGRAMPVNVWLNSTGGSVSDALAIGQRLRDAEVATNLGAGQVCLSACPYILAAGSERRVHKDAYVGVHQHYFGENTALPAFLAVEDIQRGQGEVMAYLIEMGVEPGLMQHALVTPPEAIYILVPEELTTYRLATEMLGAE